MGPRIFIDGAHGTTGLDIAERLAGRTDLTLVTLDADQRRDADARRDALTGADFAILCLPDDAAREAVALAGDAPVRFIDASTAHRTATGWTYGFAELAPGQREAIARARAVSNPGCYPTGFLALVKPLVAGGLLPADVPLSVNATSGYTGGGKAMIAEYEGGGERTAFRAYALGLAHKHRAEMQVHAGLDHAPLFQPAVAATPRGMVVEVPLHLHALPARPRVADLLDCLHTYYDAEPLVRVVAQDPAEPVRIEEMAGRDGMVLRVTGNDDPGQARLIAVLDNLGKGAGGAAVQNLNIMAGLDELAGLTA